MKIRTLIYFPLFILLLAGTHKLFSQQVIAACTGNLTWNTSSSLSGSCGLDTSSTEAYDISVGVDDATNSYIITVPNAVTLTFNSGSTLITGQIVIQTGGSVVTGSTTQAKIGQKCYVTDSDSDGYAPNTTCSVTGGAGYIRKNKMTSTTADCYDSNFDANPGQTAYFSTNRGDGSFDYNCVSGEEPSETSSAWACTNPCGGCSLDYSMTAGWETSAPACGASANRVNAREGYVGGTCYTVASCSDIISTAPLTMSCR